MGNIMNPQLLMIEGERNPQPEDMGVVWSTVAAGAVKGISAIFKGVKGVKKKRAKQAAKKKALAAVRQQAAEQAAAEQAAAEQAAAAKKKNTMLLIAAAAIPAAMFLLGNPAPALLSGRSRRRKPRTRPTLSGNKKLTKKEILRTYDEQSSMNRITDPLVIKAIDYLIYMDANGMFFADKKGKKLSYRNSLMQALDFIKY